ncbi:hypothetical protein [Ktedonobacter racemifer]|uniref:Uncharacterized protein n=1 Tax=Ktedonobacter racemifer DSM 44963 TaxID=485913 RepID=D6TK01_KTERA|nr:hypothetical protein [Ktedonobacter racemifer]EFH89758.1 conserved hypothetical protein [Ktedonobacter racemifer DSM 44963]
MLEEIERLKQALRHVYWLGGSPCAGKSSIADELVTRYGWRLYRCDDAYARHAEEATVTHEPTLYHLSRLAPDALWLERSVEQQIREEFAFYHDEWRLIVRDLEALPRDVPILAEGAALLPGLVAPLLCERSRAMWMVPTVDFQLTYYRQRAWAREVVRECRDPEQAFENWMQRDSGFARAVIQEARQYHLNVVVVDGTRTLAQNLAYVEQAWRGGVQV